MESLDPVRLSLELAFTFFFFEVNGLVIKSYPGYAEGDFESDLNLAGSDSSDFLNSLGPNLVYDYFLRSGGDFDLELLLDLDLLSLRLLPLRPERRLF